MKFSNKVFTVFSIASVFVTITPGTTTAQQQVCDCGTNTGCYQVGCADAQCGAGGCNQQGASNAACGAGGCNQDGVASGQCGAGNCSQRGTANPQCGAGNCCWDSMTNDGSGTCGAGGCNENAAACTTWPPTDGVNDESATNKGGCNQVGCSFPQCGAGGCNQDNTSDPQCGAGRCSQRNAT
eukprot:CAMPEP_0171055614 /NCGR_PEP_ID=MMETSP0736-20130129/55878_1 /TAXON_ID=186038 /ORGANISM="Fragilariopsis kerguelensis, Strain L26-C5" /LENGTH=181 /DNA_ID=CAMNT_0011510165 /DNA_START=66 /DNA_END=607 /DNA_ORIENTATION=+